MKYLTVTQAAENGIFLPAVSVCFVPMVKLTGLSAKASYI